ncbi:MAG: Mut7-C RNAse domain-containing protein [Candidatus Margulisiibacteriota bacterium]
MKFIVDDMLGKLAKRLRLMGFDASYPKTSTDSFLTKKSKEEDRILITRDTELTKVQGVNAVLIHSTKLDEQLKELAAALKLKINPEKLVPRCTICNRELKKIEKEKIKDKIPSLVRKLFHEFTYCSKCKKIYWKGSHFERMLKDLPA